MDDILVTLTPWLKPLLVFAFFTLVRYLYRTVILRVLHQFNNKSSFEYGEDLLDAFERLYRRSSVCRSAATQLFYYLFYLGLL